MNDTVDILVPNPLVSLFSSTLIVSSFSSLSPFHIIFSLPFGLPSKLLLDILHFPPLSLFPEIEGRERERELGHKKKQRLVQVRNGRMWSSVAMLFFSAFTYILIYIYLLCPFLCF